MFQYDELVGQCSTIVQRAKSTMFVIFLPEILYYTSSCSKYKPLFSPQIEFAICTIYVLVSRLLAASSTFLPDTTPSTVPELSATTSAESLSSGIAIETVFNIAPAVLRPTVDRITPLVRVPNTDDDDVDQAI